MALSNLLFLNGYVWNSPCFKYLDDNSVCVLLQLNKNYNLDIDDEQVWKYQLIKTCDDSKMKMELFDIIQQENKNIKKITYKNILKIIRDKNFEKNKNNFFQKGIYDKDITVVKNSIIENYDLIIGIMFNKLYEDIFLTILDNHLVFDYKDIAKQLVECYTKKYELKNNAFAFFIYNELENYEMAVKYIDFRKDFTVRQYINLLNKTKLKSNINKFIKNEIECIYVNYNTFIYIIYIYYIDQRYNDAIEVYKNNINRYYRTNEIAKINYLMYSIYKKLLLFDIAFTFLEEIIMDIILKIDKINKHNITLNMNTLMQDYYELIKYYNKNNNLNKLLEYSIFFIENIYPNFKTKINNLDNYSISILEILFDNEYSYEEINMYCSKSDYISRIKNAYIYEKFDILDELIKSVEIKDNITKYGILMKEIYNNNDYQKNNEKIKNILLLIEEECDQLSILYLDIMNDWINGTKTEIKEKINNLFELLKKYENIASIGYIRKKNLKKIWLSVC